MNEAIVRLAGPEDREAIRGLVSAMFGQDVSARLAWLYDGNPHGKALSWLAEDARTGAPVAVTSIFPRRVLVGDRLRVGAIGGDCYVLPSHRRQGLATALHRRALDEMPAHGVEFMFGAPLPNNLSALLKAGARPVGTARRYVRPLSAGGVPQLGTGLLGETPAWLIDRLTAVRDGSLEVGELPAFGAECDELARRMSDERCVLPLRDRSFLAWRHGVGRPPGVSVMALRRERALVGLVVVELCGNRAALVDLLATDQRVCKAALSVAAELARGRGALSLQCTVTAGCAQRLRLGWRGFFPREERVFQVSCAPDHPALSLLCDPEAWYFTDGDRDMNTSFSEPPES